MSRAATYGEDWDGGEPQTETEWEWDDSGGSLTLARLLWLAGAFAWALLAASMLSYTPTDRFGHASSDAATGEVANWIGVVGAAVASETFEMLGVGAWLMLAMAGVGLALIGFRGPVTQPGVRCLGIVTAGLALSGFHALLAPGLSSMPEGGGGLVMIAVTDLLATQLGTLGAGLTLCFMMALGLWVALDRYLIDVPSAVATGAWRRLRARALETAEWAAGVRDRQRERRENDIDDDARLRNVERFLGAAGRRAKRANAERLDDRLGGYGGEHSFDPNAAGAVVDEEDIAETAEEDDGSEGDEDDGYEYEYVEETDAIAADDDAYSDADGSDEDDEGVPGAPQVFDRDALKEKIANLPIRFAQSEKNKATQEDLDALRAQRKSEEEADRNYRFPGLDLLEDPEENFNAELERWVRDQAEALEEALQTYRIEGEVVGIESGPVITLYRVRLAPGTKVSQLTPVSSDIARMLKAVNIRIVPNEAGTDTVGIEVPNQKKEKVRLKELMTNSSAASRMKLPLFLGKDASGNPLIIDLASLPHLLIAGTTGSGKSVCMNAIISGFLYTQKPSDLKLVLVDPKMVELSQFKDIPHLMCPVVTEMSKAAAILEWAVTKMDERYELLAEAGVRDIAAYNALEWDELLDRFDPANELEEAKIPRKLPYMVFVIDELADLMMTNKEVEGAIVRIAQKARAVGIHLILATQRPQANVVTGLIKSNMPGRIAFKVASGMDSRIVLDQKGGELLLGHGDMLMLTPRSGTTNRAQGTLVDDAEIRKVVKFVRDVSGPTYERDLASIDNHGYGGEGETDGADARNFTAEEYEERMRKSAQEDPLFDRAVEIVLETQRGSVSLLQRRLAIGYTRASRLIELMGMSGIIGKHKGSVAREVLMSLEEWEAMKTLAEEVRQANEAEGAEPSSAEPNEGAEEADEASAAEETDSKDETLFGAMGFDAEGEPIEEPPSGDDSARGPDHADVIEPKAFAESESGERPPFEPDGGEPVPAGAGGGAAEADAVLAHAGTSASPAERVDAPAGAAAAVLDDDDLDDEDDPDLGFDEEDRAAARTTAAVVAEPEPEREGGGESGASASAASIARDAKVETATTGHEAPANETDRTVGRVVGDDVAESREPKTDASDDHSDDADITAAVDDDEGRREVAEADEAETDGAATSATSKNAAILHDDEGPGPGPGADADADADAGLDGDHESDAADEDEHDEDVDYVYVDEDGNPIDPEDLDDGEEYEYVYEDDDEEDGDEDDETR